MGCCLAAEFGGGWKAVTVTLSSKAKPLHAKSTEGKAEALRGIGYQSHFPLSDKQ